MKSILTSFLLFPVLTLFSQTDTSAFYESRTNILEVRGEKIYNYYYQVYPSTMAQRSGYVFVDSTGNTSELLKTKKGVQYRKQKFEALPYGRSALIQDYLEQKEYEIAMDLNKAFPYAYLPGAFMIYKGYYHGLHWEYTNESCIVQRNKIDALLLQKKDSLFAVHAIYTDVTNAFLKTIPNTDLKSLNDYLTAVPPFGDAGNGYITAVVNELAEESPNLFFSFMETVSTKDRSDYYYLIDYSHYRKLKKAETSSPIQRDLKKEKRRNAWIITGGLTATVAEIGGIVWGIVYLATRNK